MIALRQVAGQGTGGPRHRRELHPPAAARTAIFDQMSQQHIDYMLSKIPRARFVLVEEIASMVAFLVSAENSFTTGPCSTFRAVAPPY